MNPNPITNEDLLTLKEEIRNDRANSEKDIRNEMAEKVFSLDEYKIDQKVIKNTQKNMGENVKKLDKTVEKGFEKMEKLFSDLPKHFATKAEHEANRTNLYIINRVLWLIGSSILLGIIAGIGNVLINYYRP